MKINMWDLSHKMASELLKVGDEPNSPVHRIEFKGGEYPDNEIPQGGMNLDSLTRWIYRELPEMILSSIEK